MFGIILKELLIINGISQSELAKKIGYTQRAVSKWINSQSEPTETAIRKCAEFFEVSADYLLGLEDNFGDGVNKQGISCFSAEELNIIENYRQLNQSGKKLVKTVIDTHIATMAENKSKLN